MIVSIDDDGLKLTVIAYMKSLTAALAESIVMMLYVFWWKRVMGK